MNALAPLAVIGGGRMGDALVGGLLAAGALAASEVVVAEPDAARRAAVAAAHGVRTVAEGREAVAGASTVLLAVKPQVIDAVARSLAGAVPQGALVVSIAAGVTCARLEGLLAPGTPVVRVMPNTPALVGAGMAAVSGGIAATAEQVSLVREMFSAVGDAVVIDEELQDAATAISGSGPAYVAIFLAALAAAGERQGLPRALALRLATRTVSGTVELLESSGMEPQALVDAVSSPGGTTLAATERLDAHGFRDAIDEAVAAAVRRAKEL
jgi:pyrroline-5-carboxylate reductase